jgi:cell shape-determining protein MreC
MDQNKKETRRHHFLLVLFGVVLFLALQHLRTIFDFVDKAYDMVTPIVWGFLLAFILNVPMRAIERRIDKIRNKFKKDKEKELKPMNLKLKRGISFTCTVLLILIIISIMGIIIVPKMAESVVSIYNLVTTKMPDIVKILEQDKDNNLIISGIDNNFPVNIGDYIVTSGLSDIYPSGITIGTIERIVDDAYGVSKKAYIKPIGDFNNIRFVVVLDRSI